MIDKSNSKQCRSCRHWSTPDETKAGDDRTPGACKRWPPVPIVVGIDKFSQQPALRAHFPVIDAANVCGEFSAKF